MFVHQLVLHHILNFLHAGGTLHILAGILHIFCNFFNLLIGKLLIVNYRRICFLYRCHNLINIKKYLCAASLNNLHTLTSPK